MTSIAWQSFAAAAASQAILNLIPHGIYDCEGRQTPNDGLGIVVSFLKPKHEYAAMIGRRYNAKEGDWEAYDPADWWKRRE